MALARGAGVGLGTAGLVRPLVLHCHWPVVRCPETTLLGFGRIAVVAACSRHGPGPFCPRPDIYLAATTPRLRAGRVRTGLGISLSCSVLRSADGASLRKGAALCAGLYLPARSFVPRFGADAPY